MAEANDSNDDQARDLRWVLDRGWSQGDLRRAARIVERFESSPATLDALRDYDRLRDVFEDRQEQAAAARPSAGWQAFQQRATASQRTLGARLRRHRWGLVAAAACLAIAAIVPWKFIGSGPDQPALQPLALLEPSAADLSVPQSPEQLSAQLFGQISGLFDGRTSWVAVTDDDSQMGLAAEPMARRSQLLLLRLTVLHQGQVAAQTDMAILPGHSAALTVPFAGDRKLTYSIDTTADAPMTLSLWAQLEDEPGDDRTLAALMSQLSSAADAGRVEGQLVSTHRGYEFTVDFSQVTLPEPQL
jgi:hypothetical protein